MMVCKFQKNSDKKHEILQGRTRRFLKDEESQKRPHISQSEKHCDGHPEIVKRKEEPQKKCNPCSNSSFKGKYGQPINNRTCIRPFAT